MAEAWRVLEDPVNADTPPPVPDGGAKRGPGHQPLLLGAAVLVVLAACVWLVVTGASGGAVSVRAAGGAVGLANPASSVSPEATAAQRTASASGGAPTTVVVEVDGAVRRPGVYRLAADARVADAVEAAGGYGPRVDTTAAESLNLAARVADGQQIHVPARGERAAGGASGGATTGTAASGAPAGGGDTGPSGPVNVNTATSAELEALPGIGPATAAKIIAARATRPFASIDELRTRKVVGQATLEKIRGLVTVG